MGLTLVPRRRWGLVLSWVLLGLGLTVWLHGAWRLHEREGLIGRVNDALAGPPSLVSQATSQSTPAASIQRVLPASAVANAWRGDGQVPAPLQFARALALGTAGQDEAALTRYRVLFDDVDLGLAARYNAANVLLRRAMDLRASGQADQAYPMVELAKEGYREVLRREPGHRPSRYNLERALRLNPEQEADDEAPVAPERGERSATTMRATGQGGP